MDIFNLAVSNLMQIFYFIWSVLCAISAIFGLNMHWSLESGVILKKFTSPRRLILLLSVHYSLLGWTRLCPLLAQTQLCPLLKWIRLVGLRRSFQIQLWSLHAAAAAPYYSLTQNNNYFHSLFSSLSSNKCLIFD